MMKPSLPPLKPRRGILYTYLIVKPSDLHARPDFNSIDLGLRNRFDMKLARLKGVGEGILIEAIRTEENPRGDRYRLKKSKADPKSLYTYKARVTEVVDGDTLWANIDLGFRFWCERKLRFRGINAAEMKDGGKRARRYVIRALSRAAFVVLKVSGRDKFGRPLIDLFYLEGETDSQKVADTGKFLNQELIERGLAERA